MHGVGSADRQLFLHPLNHHRQLPVFEGKFAFGMWQIISQQLARQQIIAILHSVLFSQADGWHIFTMILWVIWIWKGKASHFFSLLLYATMLLCYLRFVAFSDSLTAVHTRKRSGNLNLAARHGTAREI